MMKSTKTWTLAIFATLSLGLMGCGEDSPEYAEPNQTSQEYIDATEGYESWFLLSEDTPTPSADHGGDYIITYGNAIAETAIEAGELPFPEGSIILKEQYHSTDGSPKRLSIMVKESAEEGDWYWLQTNTNGKVRINNGEAIEGDISMCAGCHGGASESDRVFLEIYGLMP